MSRDDVLIDPVTGELIDGPAGGEVKSWPVVVGVISIVLAVLGILGATCGGANILLYDKLISMAPPEMGSPPDIMRPPMWQLGFILAGMGLDVLLIVAGVMCIRRNAGSRGLFLFYGAVALLLTAVSGYFALRQQLDLRAWGAANPTDKWAAQASSPFGMIITAFFVTLGLVWTGFILLWFGLVKRTAADFGPRRAPPPV